MFLTTPATHLVHSALQGEAPSLSELAPKVLGKDYTKPAKAAKPSTTEGNFNPDAALDTTQVVWGEGRESLTMFCFETLDDTGWSCWTIEDIPTDYLNENPVWHGRTDEIQDAYERLGR